MFKGLSTTIFDLNDVSSDLMREGCAHVVDSHVVVRFIYIYCPYFSCIHIPFSYRLVWKSQEPLLATPTDYRLKC